MGVTLHHGGHGHSHGGGNHSNHSHESSHSHEEEKVRLTKATDERSSRSSSYGSLQYETTGRFTTVKSHK